jgi:hypothetical protein
VDEVESVCAVAGAVPVSVYGGGLGLFNDCFDPIANTEALRRVSTMRQ